MATVVESTGNEGTVTDEATITEATTTDECINQNETFEAKLLLLIKEHKVSELYAVIQEASKDKICASSHAFVPQLCSELLTDDCASSEPDVCPIAEKILAMVRKTCATREFLCQLCELVTAQPSDVTKFATLLRQMQRCIVHIKQTSRSHSLALALEAIYGYMSALQPPAEHNLEGRERLLLDSDANVNKSTRAVREVLSFLSPLVKEVSWREATTAACHGTSSKQVHELTIFAVKLLAQPLACLDLTSARTAGSKCQSRVCAEWTVELLSHLQPNFLKTIASLREQNRVVEYNVNAKRSKDIADNDSEDKQVPELGLSTLSFLIYSSERAPIALRYNIPVVYTSQFHFEINLPLALLLLQRTNQSLVLHKGLLLCSGLLDLLEPASYTCEVLESPDIREMLRCVVYIAASTKLKEFSTMTLAIITSLVRALDALGRNRLIHFLLKTSPNTGVVAHVVVILRDEILTSLEQHVDPNRFAGENLERLLQVLFSLPRGERSDLLDHSERIISALTLLRVLIARDTIKQNATGIWNLIPMIEQKYFAVLRAGINLSRSHYKLELKKMREALIAERKAGRRSGVGNSKGGGGVADGTRSEGSGGGLVDLSLEQQIPVLEMAVDTFNKMEAIVNNLTRLIDSQRKENESGDH